jgi:hypothetical protein
VVDDRLNMRSSIDIDAMDIIDIIDIRCEVVSISKRWILLMFDAK